MRAYLATQLFQDYKLLVSAKKCNVILIKTKPAEKRRPNVGLNIMFGESSLEQSDDAMCLGVDANLQWVKRIDEIVTNSLKGCLFVLRGFSYLDNQHLSKTISFILIESDNPYSISLCEGWRGGG